MKLQESGEMYLETILILSQESDSLRAVDVAKHMGITKASVSRAVHVLQDDGSWTRRRSRSIRQSSGPSGSLTRNSTRRTTC